MGFCCWAYPTVMPQEAKRLLVARGPAAVLVDVRTPERFSAGHIEGAVNWPLEKSAPPAARTSSPRNFAARRC